MRWEQKRTVHRGSRVFTKHHVPTCYQHHYSSAILHFFTLSIIQFLMEKHHECRGDVAQTCLCGWDCLLRSFHQCSPFLRDNVKNILEGNALTNNHSFETTPSDENKKRRRVAHTFTLPAQADSQTSAQKQENKIKKRKCIAKLTERLH